MTEPTGGPLAGPRRAVALLPAALLVLGACGTDDAADDTADDASTPSTPSASVPDGAPACAEIWEEGATIPRLYKGCVQDGAYVERDAIACSSGQFLVRFDDRYWGAAGGTIHEVDPPLDEDRDYRAATRTCTA